MEELLVAELDRLGLAAEVQEATAVEDRPSGPFREAGRVRNILARLQGKRAGSRAVLLMAHYDSVASTPGAADDGLGVATLLETARALKAEAPLDNDVIFLFSDGEELGDLGARAFVTRHPWAGQVGLVLNFDARGNHGPSVMFQTSPGNRWLMEALAEVAPGAVAYSVSQAIYSLLPNQTDLNETLAAGWPGMGFACVEGVIHYHRMSDLPALLDPRTLQQQGDTALALTRHFGAVALDGKKVEEPVGYFRAMGRLWLMPVPGSRAGGLILGVAFLLVFAARRRQMRPAGLVMGFVGGLAVPVVALAAVMGMVWGLDLLSPGFDWILPAFPTAERVYVFAALGVAGGLTSAGVLWIRRRWSAESVEAGGLALWLALGLGIAGFAPVAGYLALLPAAGPLALWGARLLRPGWRRDSISWVVAAGIAALPAVVLGASHAFLFQTISNSPVPPAVLGSLFLVLLGAQVEIVFERARRWLLPLSGVAVVLALATVGLAARKQANTLPPSRLYYAVDAGAGQAFWLSPDIALDPWTAQLLAGGAPMALERFQPWRSEVMAQAREAPLAPYRSPEIAVLADARDGGARQLRLQISHPDAAALGIFLRPEAKVLSASINGEPFAPSSAGGVDLRYWAPPPGKLELDLRLGAAGPLSLRVVADLPRMPALPALEGPGPLFGLYNPLPGESALADGGRTLVMRTFSL